MAETRGIINNNPFNIKRGSSRWLGKVPHKDSTDKVFEQFTDIDYGLRAGIILLRNYINQGYNTYSLIISRFSPSTENNVSGYINFLSDDLSWCPDCVFAYKSDYFFNMVHRICFYESRYDFTLDHYKTILQNFNL